MRFHLDFRGYPVVEVLNCPIMSLEKGPTDSRDSADSNGAPEASIFPYLVGLARFVAEDTFRWTLKSAPVTIVTAAHQSCISNAQSGYRGVRGGGATDDCICASRRICESEYTGVTWVHIYWSRIFKLYQILAIRTSWKTDDRQPSNRELNTVLLVLAVLLCLYSDVMVV